jgi:hypothetical protein
MKPSPVPPVPIDVVAKHYLGEPFSKSDREWRYGNKGSLSINLDNNVWFDHEANKGGGVLILSSDKKGLMPTLPRSLMINLAHLSVAQFLLHHQRQHREYTIMTASTKKLNPLKGDGLRVTLTVTVASAPAWGNSNIVYMDRRTLKR